jgi:hypothetical protein
VLLAGRVAYARGYARRCGGGAGKATGALAKSDCTVPPVAYPCDPVNDGCGGSGVRVRRSRMPFLPSADARSFRRLGLTPELRSPAFIC